MVVFMIKIKPVIVDNVDTNATAKTKDITQFGKFAISVVNSVSASGLIDYSLILFSYFKSILLFLFKSSNFTKPVFSQVFSHLPSFPSISLFIKASYSKLYVFFTKFNVERINKDDIEV